MKLTTKQLRQIILEEFSNIQRESIKQLDIGIEDEYKEIEDYCVGMSVNLDLQWKKGSNVEFLKTRNVEQIKTLLKSFAGDKKIGKMKIVDDKVQQYGDQDPEYGFTYYVTLGQSHMAVHTWPEMFLMNIDIFTCGDEGDPKAIAQKVIQTLKPDRVRKNEFNRSRGLDWKSVEDNNKDKDVEKKEKQLSVFYSSEFMKPC